MLHHRLLLQHRLLGTAIIVLLLVAVAVLAVDRIDGERPHDESAFIVWTSGALPDGFADRVADLDTVTAVSVVRANLVDLRGSWDAEGNAVDQPPAGTAIPLDALAVDPQAHAASLPAGARAPFLELAPGSVLLGERSARLRGLGPGATMELGTGERVTVANVVDDELVGHAEIMLPVSTPGVDTARFVVLVHNGDPDAVEQAVRSASDGAPVRVQVPEEMAFRRHGASLLPQVVLKERFGEFSYRPAAGRQIDQENAWRDAHIRTRRVPILGEVVCHRDILPALEGAMRELEEAGLASAVDPGDYAGCYGPRLIGPGQALSRHAWGIAVDLNATTNAYGDPPTIDGRVVDTMARWGFTWGGAWLNPDGMHFEYVSEPQ